MPCFLLPYPGISYTFVRLCNGFSLLNMFLISHSAWSAFTCSINDIVVTTSLDDVQPPGSGFVERGMFSKSLHH